VAYFLCERLASIAQNTDVIASDVFDFSFEYEQQNFQFHFFARLEP
jgi:hypothetical protein